MHRLHRTGLGLCGTLACFLFAGCERPQPETRSSDLITVRTVGLAFLEENRLEEAEAEFLKLVELAPDEALGFANLGLVYLRMGQFEDAQEHAKAAKALEPTDADIRLILAKVYELTERFDDARRELEEALANNPDHVKTLYTLAELYREIETEGALRQRRQYLARVVELVPANVAARLQLVEVLLQVGEPQTATAYVEEIRRQVPQLPLESTDLFDRGLRLMRAGQAEDALEPTIGFHNVLRTTPIYQAGLQDLRGPGGVLIGFPIVTFSQDFSLQAEDQEAVLAALRFTDVTSLVGLDMVPPSGEALARAPLAIADYDGDNDQDLYVGSAGMLLRNDLGAFVDASEEAGMRTRVAATGALFADYDNDAWLDLYIVTAGPNALYRNRGNGTFREVAGRAGVRDDVPGFAPVFVDLDHDGDLDLYLANAGENRAYRNNLDGSFVDRTRSMRLAGSEGATSRDAVLGDFDDDNDIDLFVVNANASNVMYSNLRQGQFEDVTEPNGLATTEGSAAAAVADYDNDGFIDLFVASASGRGHALFRNDGDGTFTRDLRPTALFEALEGVVARDATWLDFDNDGFRDLLVAGEAREGTGRGVFLFNNAAPGRFDDVSSLLPADLSSGLGVAVADYDEDGDVDLFIAGVDGRVRLLRNDGGSANRYLKIELVGLSTGSGKNNHFGIGAKLEVRAGGLYQMRVVSQPVNHFGLGHRLKADVVRIQWTNGVPQNLFYPGSDQDLVEEQSLKGSCAFLYTWNGNEYAFVTDVMWRSALGMPLGIMGGGGRAGGGRVYAPPHASQEYLRIPGQLLTAKDGVYSLQITEELWETAYVDELKLLVVDHPDSVDIFVNERFVPPASPALRVYQVAQQRAPVAAVDARGNDLLPLLREKDDDYVGDLTPVRYQGMTQLHDLILDPGDVPGDSLFLFLHGWIFPTDASINVAISQSDAIEVVPPHLQVRDPQGRWRTVIENLSFPSGKDKVVIADLTGRFLSKDRRVRIRTNMEVYWDHVFFANGSQAPLRITKLQPKVADLHYRGFSRLYRKGRYGPHWFDYGDVSREAKWRDLEGYYTRYGDVLPLLLASDDRYAIMNSGDEITVEFDATLAPELPPGWTRDYLLYSDGWIKDGDLNTASGNTVAPLPFHGMSRYPYGSDEAYPSDAVHREYLETYNTRRVTRKSKE